MLAIAIAIKLDSPGPVFYRQERVGKDGARFRMIKFRSMRQDADRLLAELQRQQRGERPAVQDAATIRASPGSAASCADRAWTSCRRSSTCCAAR